MSEKAIEIERSKEDIVTPKPTDMEIEIPCYTQKL